MCRLLPPTIFYIYSGKSDNLSINEKLFEKYSTSEYPGKCIFFSAADKLGKKEKIEFFISHLFSIVFKSEKWKIMGNKTVIFQEKQ